MLVADASRKIRSSRAPHAPRFSLTRRPGSWIRVGAASDLLVMIEQQHCPFCRTSAGKLCAHLALAVEGRDFVRRCVGLCQGESQWRALCEQWRGFQRSGTGWSSEQEDFMWLETAFCERFLKRLNWYGGIGYEWRTGAKLDRGGFWVLLWSKDPQRLWWELRDEFERQILAPPIARRTVNWHAAHPS